MDEYYTPSIDEFIEGFEFEYYGDRGEDNSRWHPTIMKENDRFWTEACLHNRLAEYSIPLVRAKIKI